MIQSHAEMRPAPPGGSPALHAVQVYFHLRVGATWELRDDH